MFSAAYTQSQSQEISGILLLQELVTTKHHLVLCLSGQLHHHVILEIQPLFILYLSMFRLEAACRRFLQTSTKIV